MSEPPQPRRAWQTLGPCLFVAVLSGSVVGGCVYPPLLLTPLLIVILLLGRDYGLPWYRDPRFPKAMRKRRLLKLVCRVVKWPATIIVMLLLLQFLALWKRGAISLDEVLFPVPYVLVAAALWLADERMKWPEPIGRCQTCGYDLTGNVSGRCPECGTPVPPPE